MIDQFDEFAEDFLMEKSDRLIVIICASKLDDILFSILNKFLLDKTASSKDDLLEGDQPLATFSSRIKITFRLGIIDKSLFDLLEQVRAIRNKSAHNVSFDIKKSPFKDHVLNIRNNLSKRKSYLLTKKRYFNDSISDSTRDLQCLLLSSCVILQAVSEKVVKIQECAETKRISNN